MQQQPKASKFKILVHLNIFNFFIDQLQAHTVTLTNPQEGGSRFLRNIGTYLPYYKKP